MLTELLPAAALPLPAAFAPCPPLRNRAAWDALPGFDRWLALGNQARRTPPAPLPLHLWLDFTHTGNRARFEDAYFSRRRSLVRLVMAEALSDSGALLPAIADYVWAICEERAWQLPAHNQYLRDTPQQPLPDLTRPVVDLFAAETGALLAMVYHLLRAPLHRAAPGLPARIKAEVEARLLRPWRSRHFWWMGSGDEEMCNWTPWCTQNLLLCTALLHPKNPARIDTAVRQSAYSLDCFLKDYGEDGCCSEGAQYYRHAALCLYNALELLCALAPGVFDSVWQTPKIKNMAEYIAQMHVAGAYYLNFADCSPLAGARGAREYLFGKRVGSAPLMALAAADFAADADPDRQHSADASEGINLFYAVQTCFAEEEIRAAAHTASAMGDAWYPSVGLRVVRAGVYTAGMKAGGNADSHNHNDTGSITLYKNGAPLLVDVGVETYSKKTFSPQRYEIWTMQSSWHNLPEFDPDGAAYQQQPGAGFAARAVQTAPDGLAMDLAPAYGDVPGLGFYRRCAALTPDGLRLTDETDYPRLVALSLMSEQPPTVCQSDSRCTVQFGALGAAHITGGVQRVETEAVPITDPRLRTAWPETLYRTRIYFTGSAAVEVV